MRKFIRKIKDIEWLDVWGRAVEVLFWAFSAIAVLGLLALIVLLLSNVIVLS